MASESVPAISRRIAGAKSHLFPERGSPARWEVKATDTISPDAWQRKRNRLLAQEAIRILEGVGCTVYSASITKVNTHHQMAQKTTVPLLLQALVQYFASVR